MNWKKIGLVAGAVLSILGIIAILYQVDCWNVKAAGTEHFTTLPTFLAMQRQVSAKFDSWDLKDKQRQISEYDAAYGASCARCDSKLKSYYDWLVLERNKLIEALKAKPAQ